MRYANHATRYLGEISTQAVCVQCYLSKYSFNGTTLKIKFIPLYMYIYFKCDKSNWQSKTYFIINGYDFSLIIVIKMLLHA